MRVSGPVERQQTKWVMLGIAGLGVGVLGPYTVMDPDSVLFALVGVPVIMVSMSLLPLSIGFSIMRYRLWDIGVFVNRALVYSLLTAILVGTYAGAVIGLQAAFRAVTDQGSAVAIVISTLAIAALFQPMRGRIQDFIDRRFYCRKYDAAQTLADFSDRMRDEVDLDRLAGELVTVVEDTMQPAHVSLWLRGTGAQSPGGAPR